jgi:FlaG/FlaF family flagellin (archaellin)
MRRTKATIASVAEQYSKEIKRAFPDAETEVIFETIGGHDVWVRVHLPPHLHQKDAEVFDKTALLGIDLADETGVNIVATIVYEDEEASTPSRA